MRGAQGLNACVPSALSGAAANTTAQYNAVCVEKSCVEDTAIASLINELDNIVSSFSYNEERLLMMKNRALGPCPTAGGEDKDGGVMPGLIAQVGIRLNTLRRIANFQMESIRQLERVI